MTFGSLFSGAGGLDLGLERAGLRCAWQCEIDPYARRVLEKHWPDVRRWDDVRTFPPAGDWSCDLIGGGFPCTDISPAGKRKGIDGKQSGLWVEFSRILGVIRPRFVLVENSADLSLRGLGRVLGDLCLLGFDVEWQVISARSAGAPHLRRRTFIVCYPNGSRRAPVMDAKAHKEWAKSCKRVGWDAEPRLGRVVARTSHVVDRLRVLGNAVVPQVAEWIGRRILEAEREALT